MPSNFVKYSIEKVYEMVLKKIDGGMLYGEQIDLNNPKHVGVAFYLEGLKEGHSSGMRFLDYLEGERISK